MIPHFNRVFLLVTSATLSVSAQAQTQEGAASEQRPAYRLLRQGEDWSGFRAADSPVDPFDPLKHVALSDDGDVWVSFGGRIEARIERWENFEFSAPNDDTFVLSRALLHSDFHFGEHLRVFVEGKTAQATDRDLPGGRRFLDMDTLALQQGFADVVLPLSGDSSLVLRPGRQVLRYGSGRLIAPGPWSNTMRTWDGLTAEWASGPWRLTGLAVAFAPVQKTDFNSTDWNNQLFGLFAERGGAGRESSFELYGFGNRRQDVTFNGTTGDESRLTLGGRAFGPLSESTDYEVEAAYQLGEVGEGDVDAWFLAAKGQWDTGSSALAPQLWAGFELASGDDEAGGDVGTFHQLFPFGHRYLGRIDAIGRQNIVDGFLGGRWKLSEWLDASLAYHWFRLMEAGDALYNAGGAPYRSGFSSKDVGTEIDALLTFRLGRHLSGYGGYSHFFAGDAIEESGPGEDVDFLYLGLGFTF